MTRHPEITNCAAVADRWLSVRDDVGRYTLIREFQGKSVYRFDLAMPDLPTIIVKSWDPQRGSTSRRIKRALVGELSGCENEIATLQWLRERAPGLRAPIGYARFVNTTVMGKPCEVGLISDLGDCETLADHLKRTNAGQDLQALDEIASFIVHSLNLLLNDARLIDDDHSVINMLRSRADGVFHRIDFEIARRAEDVRSPEKATGLMLGRLLATCAFACQPDVQWVSDLAVRLRTSLPQVTLESWRHAQIEMNRRLRWQFDDIGIDTRVELHVGA